MMKFINKNKILPFPQCKFCPKRLTALIKGRCEYLVPYSITIHYTDGKAEKRSSLTCVYFDWK